MEKPNIKKLKYPLWFTIVFYCLTVLAPLVLVMVQGYQSESKVFRITFGVISSALIVWMFINKFLLAATKKELREKKLKLEHEYEIEIGNQENIKYLWFSTEQWLFLFSLVDVILFGGLLLVIIEGIASGVMSFKGVTIFVTLCYIVAYSMKFVVITAMKNKEYKEENNNEEKLVSESEDSTLTTITIQHTKH